MNYLDIVTFYEDDINILGSFVENATVDSKLS